MKIQTASGRKFLIIPNHGIQDLKTGEIYRQTPDRLDNTVRNSLIIE